MAEPLGDERAKFEVDEEIAYFNTASLSPLLHSVRAAGDEALVRRGKPWTTTSSDWFTDSERLRARFAQLVGAGFDDVALVPATSYGLAVAARNLEAGPGDRVLVLADEFPSNYYTWRRFADRTGAELHVVEREPGQTWTEAILGAVDERVAVASIPNVHWTNGVAVDLQRVGAALRAAGSAFVVDANQSLGALRTGSCAPAPTTSRRSSTTATSTCRARGASTSASARTSSSRRWRSRRSSRSLSGRSRASRRRSAGGRTSSPQARRRSG